MADVKLEELVINECSSVPSTFEPNQLYLTPDTTEEDIANALKQAKEYTDSREQDVRSDFADADSELQTQINGQATAITEAQGDIVDLQNNKQDVISDLNTIRSGAEKGATAVQPSDLSAVATSGSYNDLANKPTIPTVNNGTLTIQKNGATVATFSANQSGNVTANIVADTQVNADWNATSGAAQILNKPTLSAVAKSGSYNDLTNKPTIPTTPSQVGALPDTTKYGADLSYSENQLQLLDQDGNALGNSVEIKSGGSSNDKLDIDLGNATSTTRETIVGWGMPDYSTGVSRSWDTSYQAEKDTIICYQTNHQSGNANVEPMVSSDNSNWIILYGQNAGTSQLKVGGWFICPKGWYWKIVGGRNVDRMLKSYIVKGEV